MFGRLRDALRAALDAATPPGDLARQMREAVIEAKVAVQAQTRREGSQHEATSGRSAWEPRTLEQ